MHRLMIRLLPRLAPGDALSCALCCTFGGAVVMAILGTAPRDAAAQAWPAQPVRIIVPFAAGNVLDAMLRTMGERSRELTGQPFVVEARPGAGGIVAAQALINAKPDGYTVLLATQGMLAINPHIYRKLPYDPTRDFALVSEVTTSPMLLATHPSVPARTMAEFVAWALANKGKVSYGSIAPGTISHFLSETINFDHATAMTHVPYKGTPALLPDLLGGRIQAAFVSVDTVRSQVQSGKLNALLLSGTGRDASLPAVPTAREAGFPRLEAFAWSGFVVPAGTPESAITALAELTRKIVATPEVAGRVRQLGLELVGSTPAEFVARTRAESEKWSGIIKASGFSAD